jgi:hypothetical protein
MKAVGQPADALKSMQTTLERFEAIKSRRRRENLAKLARWTQR